MVKEQRMKVLQIVGAMNRAGTETMLMNIFRNIDRTKIQFDFISYSEEDAHYDEEIKQLGGNIYKLKNTQSMKEILNVIKEHGPYDVVHAHTLFHCGIANMAGKLAGVKKRIAHAHTTLDDNKTLKRKLYIFIMRKIILLFSTHRLACSNEAGRYLFGSKKEMTYFPNVIDYNKFLLEQSSEVKKVKEELGLTNQFVIGHVGRFIDAKNHQFLLNVFKKVLEKEGRFHLLLVGDGDLKDKIEKEVNAFHLKDKVIFTGIREDVDVLLKSMDIFVFPSKYEGLGLVLLEAQATGLPCIVSHAIQSEADVKLGLMTKLSLTDNVDIWAEKIIENLHKHENDKQKIQQAFKKHNYSIESAIHKLQSIYCHGG